MEKAGILTELQRNSVLSADIVF